MAKGSNAFKAKIKKEMDLRAFKEPLFEKLYKNPEKNIDDCIAYIMKTVQDSGCNGFEDNEIYSMAIHYYSEKDLDIKVVPSSGHVVVNHKVELTLEEIEEARERARNAIIQEERDKMLKKKKPKVVKQNINETNKNGPVPPPSLSLF